MKNMVLKVVTLVIAFGSASLANAATTWSAQDYDLYPGDFNGDGKTDVLYIPKDPSLSSGIAASDGAGPNIAWQSWPSNYLGIQWYGRQYTAVVADFNHDGKADILLQRSTAGDSYLLLADANGRITGISQTFSSSALGLAWSKDEHTILAGDFNGDGRADLLFQAAASSGTNAIVLADANGMFTLSPTQSWTDSSWSAFKWSRSNAVISVGDFNGDGKADLLVQTKPRIVMIDYDIPIPVPVYTPNSYGVVLAQSGSSPLQQTGVQQWSRTSNGVDWSPNFANAVLGDFNGDGRVDVFLQAKSSGKSSFVLNGNASGAAFSAATAVSGNVPIAADSAKLVVGNFDGVSGAGLYLQSNLPTGTNAVTNVVGSTIVATTHNAALVIGFVPPTAVGSTAGSFDVTHVGAATYRIPIVVPPGIRGIQPNLALTYSSQDGNGFAGVGWHLGGLSQITRCAANFAQDGFNREVSLYNEDRFCLDGNKLRITNSPTYSYGQAGSTYATELETFSRVTAIGSSGTLGGLSVGPLSFTVERKDGLTYEYGNTADSRVEALTTTTPHTWLLNRVSDRSGNSMSITYLKDGSPNGSYRPNEISYTSNSIAGVVAPYQVKFFWEQRPVADYITEYIAGHLIRQTYRLDRIETYYNSSLVRKYDLSYQQGSTSRSRLSAVQECGGNGSCLSPTILEWQDGGSGWLNETDASATGLDSTAAAYARAIDFDGDGRTDLVYPRYENGSRYWTASLSNGSGFVVSPQALSGAAGTTQQIISALPFYRSKAGGAVGLLLDAPLTFAYSDGNAKYKRPIFASFPINMPASVSPAAVDDRYWAGDIDGETHTDVVYSTTSGTYSNFYLLSGADGRLGGQYGTSQLIYSMYGAGAYNPITRYQPLSQRGPADFNGDGKTDLVVESYAPNSICTGEGALASCYDSPIYTWTVLLASQSGFSSVATGASGGCEAPVSCARVPLFVADFNGDGLTDLIYNGEIRFGSGAGLTDPTPVSLPANIAEGIVADINGDGRADLLYKESATSTSWFMAIWNGSDFTISAASFIPPDAMWVRLLDIDADGLMDLGYYRNGAYKIRLHQGPSPDLLSTVTDGFGNRVSVTYASLSDAAVYSNTTTSPVDSGTEAEGIPPRMVVKQYSVTDGLGGEYSISEHFSVARMTSTRGFLGYALHEETDSRTGIVKHWDFRHTSTDPTLISSTMLFPMTGRPAREWVTQADGTLISDVTNTYALVYGGQSVALGSVEFDLIFYTSEGIGGPGSLGEITTHAYPYIQQRVQKTYEVGGVLNGQALAEITSKVESIDQYGTPLITSVETKDVSVSSPWNGQTTKNRVVNTVSNNEQYRCLGLAETTQTTTTLADSTTQTRSVQRTIDYQKCRVTDVITEPNTASLSVATHYDFASAACGNPTAVVVTGHRNDGSALPPRSTSLGYGSECVAPKTITDAMGQQTLRTYNYAFGSKTSEKDPNGQVGNWDTKWDYDAFGRVMTETRPDGTTTTIGLTACNAGNSYCGVADLRMRVDTTHRDSAGNPIDTTYSYADSFGRNRIQASPLPLTGELSSVVSTYDVLGRLSSRSAPYTQAYQGKTVYGYDIVGRQTSAILYDASGTVLRQTGARYEGRKMVSIDPRLYETKKTSDVAGQLRRVEDPTSSLYTAYDYTFSDGNLISTVTDKAGNKIVITANLIGNKIQSQDPDMGTWVFQYDSFGELTKQVDAKNQETTFSDYDALGRQTYRYEVEGTTTFVYASPADHGYGQLKSISAGGYTESYDYDTKSRLLATHITIPGEPAVYDTSYAYQANTGLIDTITYPQSTGSYPLKVKYDYTHGVQTSVRDYTNNTLGTTYWQLTATDSMGHAIGETLGNGMRVASTYDAVTGLLTSRQSGTDTGATNRQNLSYLWDASGNLQRRTDNNQSGLYESFFYDEINRLDYSTRNGTTNLDMTYNEIGNVTVKSDVGTYAYPASGPNSVRPHAVTAAGSGSYAYDDNGNMTTRPGATVNWYSANAVKKITQGAVSSEFWYAPTGDRYKQYAVYSSGTENTIYVGGLMDKVTLGTGAVAYRHYISAGSNTVILTRWSNNTVQTYYATTDHLGSSSVVTDQSGAVVVNESFDAFGKRRGANWSGAPMTAEMQSIANATRDGYTGHEHLDNLGLIHMNGRVQDPTLGRFISADPHIQAPEFSQSLNRYSYVWNNPLNMTDPTGFDGKCSENGCDGGSVACKMSTNCVTIWYEFHQVWVPGDSVSAGPLGGNGVTSTRSDPGHYEWQVDAVPKRTWESLSGLEQYNYWLASIDKGAYEERSPSQITQQVGEAGAIASTSVDGGGGEVGAELAATMLALKGARTLLVRQLSARAAALEKSALLKALALARPTGGHPRQLMATMADGTRVLFRKDFGEQAHPVGGPFQNKGDIDHYNIEIQSANGKKIENVHIVSDGSGGFTFWGKDGVVK